MAPLEYRQEGIYHSSALRSPQFRPGRSGKSAQYISEGNIVLISLIFPEITPCHKIKKPDLINRISL